MTSAEMYAQEGFLLAEAAWWSARVVEDDGCRRVQFGASAIGTFSIGPAGARAFAASLLSAADDAEGKAQRALNDAPEGGLVSAAKRVIVTPSGWVLSGLSTTDRRTTTEIAIRGPLSTTAAFDALCALCDAGKVVRHDPDGGQSAVTYTHAPEDPRWAEVRRLRATAEDCAHANNLLGAAWNDGEAERLAREILATKPVAL